MPSCISWVLRLSIPFAQTGMLGLTPCKLTHSGGFTIDFTEYRMLLTVAAEEKQRVKNSLSVDYFLGKVIYLEERYFLFLAGFSVHIFNVCASVLSIDNFVITLAPASPLTVLSSPFCFHSFPAWNCKARFRLRNACWNSLLFLYTKIQKIYLYHLPAASRFLIKQRRVVKHAWQVRSHRKWPPNECTAGPGYIFQQDEESMKRPHPLLGVSLEQTTAILFLLSNIKNQVGRLRRQAVSPPPSKPYDSLQGLSNDKEGGFLKKHAILFSISWLYSYNPYF